MTTKMKMILAGACLALAGCGGGGGGIAAAPAGLVPVDDPGRLGLEFQTPVTVMSADRVKGNTAKVSQVDATITLNDLTFDADGNLDTFSIKLVLPDLTEVTLTQDTPFDNLVLNNPINGQDVIRATLTADNAVVELVVGLGLATDILADTVEDAVGDALFALLRVDHDEVALGFNTYLVTGEETGTLPPSGEATYSGETIATVYQGSGLGKTFTGNADITAFFDFNTVNVSLDGNNGSKSYDLFAQSEGGAIAIVGSRYVGVLSGQFSDSPSSLPVELAGDVVGAFFGDAAEATAGVFAAEKVVGTQGPDVEIVGGFAAYDDSLLE